MPSLTREFLAWISSRPRSYAETMEARRTSCPRHSVWEDALIAGLVRIDEGQKVILTGEHSIRINDQWRICFRWQDGDAHDVEIVDYH